MIITTQTVDFNGIVIFDPERLIQYFGDHIKEGTNIYRLMTTTQAGDDVLSQGIVVPIMGINDSTYEIMVRNTTEPSPVSAQTIISNGIFPLHIKNRLVLADMAVFLEWEEETGWQTLSVAPGFYGVTLHGFRFIAEGKIQRYGYDIELKTEVELPIFTGKLDMNMQILECPTR